MGSDESVDLSELSLEEEISNNEQRTYSVPLLTQEDRFSRKEQLDEIEQRDPSCC